MTTSTSIELLKRAVDQLELEIGGYTTVPSRLSRLVADINRYLNDKPNQTTSNKVESDDDYLERELLCLDKHISFF